MKRIRVGWILAIALGVLAGIYVASCGDNAPEMAGRQYPDVADAGANPARISVTVSPRVMVGTRDINIRVKITPYPENAVFSVSWTSDVGRDGGMRRTLDADSPIYQEPIVLRDAPAASYYIVATLYRKDATIIAYDHAEVEAGAPETRILERIVR